MRLKGLLPICTATLAGAMNVPTELLYAKLTSMVEGAKIVGKIAGTGTGKQ